MIFKLGNLQKEKFECPVCGYSGPFMDFAPPTGIRKHAKCPNCNALERHRIQFVVVSDVLKDRNTAQLKMLHFAPEPFFREFFSQRFGQYETADLKSKDVDHNVDLQQLPFADGSYDFVFASHVLEHIPDDRKALSEIRRILKPNGIAILPVPIISQNTIEYPEPNPHESYHVRAPGMDYFDRYERHFRKVERFSSDPLPKKYQLFVYEDRSQFPTEKSPLRTPMPGEKFSDVVPVCYV
ncbi:MAG: methyltransferase domain-containing protein [Nitrospiraceae bacterium]